MMALDLDAIYWQAQKALDEILGPNEEDGAGGGLVAEIWLVAEQRDKALRQSALHYAEVQRLREDVIAPLREERDAYWARLERYDGAAVDDMLDLLAAGTAEVQTEGGR